MVDIPGNSSTTATVTVGSTTSGGNATLETLGDHDWYRIELTAGQSITVELNGITLEDPYLRLRDASGNLLVENDDIVGGVNRNSKVGFTAPSTGTYYIDVGAWEDGYAGSYDLVVSPYDPPPVWTYDQIADQLVNGYWYSNGETPSHFNVGPAGSITVNVTALTSAGQFFALEALDMWSDVIGVSFVPVTSGGQITFDDNEQGAFSTSGGSGGYTTWAHVNVETAWIAGDGTNLDSYSFQTYLHEIGHALGLGHAGNYNGDANYLSDALYANDAWSTSIMSYFDQQQNTYFGSQGFTVNFIVTPMLADVVAMSMMYGTSTTTRTGDTTYGFNSNADRAIYNASNFPDVAYAIFDSDGTDTLDYSGFSAAQRINLNAETFSNVGGNVGNVSIGRGVVIENAIGGSGNDTLIGNSAANILTGGAGNDTIQGGSGPDTANYRSAASGVTVSLALAGAQNTGGAGTDTLSSIENLTGSNFNDTLTGNSSANVLEGGLGNDLLNGGSGTDTASYASATSYVVVNLALTGAQNTRGAGTDTLASIERLIGSAFNDQLTGGSAAETIYGRTGNDVIKGGAGNDIFYGDDGDDRLEGGAGNDTLNGNTGKDTAIYSSATAGVTVSMAITTAQSTGGAGSDILNSIERLIGSGFADSLSGNTSNNVIYGEGGNDTISANSGSDVIYGGLGNDTLTGGLGRDTFEFDSALNAASNVDDITDFVAGYDRIRLDDSVFTQLSGTTLNSSAFRAGAAAADADDRVIFNSATGNLYYDADGTGAGSQVLFAHIDAGTALTYSDFLIG